MVTKLQIACHVKKRFSGWTGWMVAADDTTCKFFPHRASLLSIGVFMHGQRVRTIPGKGVDSRLPFFPGKSLNRNRIYSINRDRLVS